MFFAILWKRSRLERGVRCTRSELEARQSRAIAQLRSFAVERSPFYQRFHRGFEQRPWAELPILSKADLMANFDDLVTDRSVRLADVEAHLEHGNPNTLFRGRYVVLATSGSTGRRGIFLFSPAEWLDVVAGSTRPGLWVGLKPNLFRRQRIAGVGSTFPWHITARVGQSLRTPLFPMLQLDACEPHDSMVRRLNEWQPAILAAYPSVLRILANAQLAGRLRISPRFVCAGTEVFTVEDRRRVKEAWDAVAYDVYAATEYMPIAAECPLGQKHLVEDGAAIEVVDNDGRPVPDGILGSRVLLTVFNRWTQPLIRYELSDMLRLAEARCECGRPFRIIEQIEGRQEHVLLFGTTPVHPIVFHRVLDAVPAAGWQVVREPSALRVCLLGLREDYQLERLEEAIRQGLVESGAEPPPIRVIRTESLQRGPTGKADLILSRPIPTAK
jgi:putative adenylate-forming enzyme